MADSKFHPALSVTNIKNLIPITLEMEKSHYASWAELFRIHCRVYAVLDHIIPSTTTEKSKDKEGTPSTPTVDPATWSRLDAVVLQWIYSTISTDLLHTILTPNATAAQAWISLKNIFQDNKSSRAVYLEHQFSNTRLDNFSNISSYCQELKILSDQLANVDAPVSNQRLVLQLIAGLNENYDNVAAIIQQTDPLPQFYEARSKLIMEENRKQQQTSDNTNTTALLAKTKSPAKTSPPTEATTDTNSSQPTPPSQQRNIINNQPFRGRGRNQPFRGGRGGRGGRGRGNHSASWANYPNWAWPPYGWTTPPPPYPTSPWYRPGMSNSANSAQGVLGPRPQQSYASSLAPTDIEQAMHTMTLHPPDDQWYMDTGATSHMTASQDGNTHHAM